MRNDQVVKRPADPAELTGLYTDEAIRFIEQNKENPFFLYLPHTMFHNPLGVSAGFKGSSNWGGYNDAFFYHGSHGALAAVRWRNWKLYLNPTLELYDLVQDPGESTLVRNPKIQRKLRGMAVLFQDEMRLDARPAGDVPTTHAQ